MNKLHSANWRIWQQLNRLATAESVSLVHFSSGLIAGAAIERMHNRDDLERLLTLKDMIASERLAQLAEMEGKV
jgi:hypothetical protein